MKSTILLATALFLISAPAPDSSDIAQMTSNFIVPVEIPGLLANEELMQGNRHSDSAWNTEAGVVMVKAGVTNSAQLTHSKKPGVR